MKGNKRPAGIRGALLSLLFREGRDSDPMDPTGMFKVDLSSSDTATAKRLHIFTTHDLAAEWHQPF
jgi:hypothetical protein